MAVNAEEEIIFPSGAAIRPAKTERRGSRKVRRILKRIFGRRMLHATGVDMVKK